MRRPKPGFRLLLITDATACSQAGRGVVVTVARALLPSAPGTALVVRAKDHGIDDVATLCAALLPIARRAGALLLVHTHVELVERLGLDGAHLSSTDEPRKARARLRPGKLLGASRHRGDPLDEDALSPLDYITLSPVFPPSSKPDDTRPTLGLSGLERLCAASARPVVALGGINAHNAPACLRHGAAGVAGIADVMSAHNPRRAWQALHHAAFS